MINIKGFIKRTKISCVFTPASAATLTYIERPLVENIFSKELEIRGKQIILYGMSGSGKTTMIRHLMKKMNRPYIYTQCMVGMTMEDILKSAFDKLDRYYISQRSCRSGISLSSELKNEFLSVKSNVSSEDSATQTRVIAPQLTPERLAKFLGEIGALWVIEDFHKVSMDVRIQIAGILKTFIGLADDYENVRIICIGAVGKASELLQIEPNLNNRVSQIEVPLLDNREVESIIEKGSKILNVVMADNLKQKICYYSHNLGSLVHQMCYDICYKNGIKKACFLTKRLDESKFIDVIESHISSQSDSFRTLYEYITKERVAWYILKTMVEKGKTKISSYEIISGINYKSNRYSETEILNKLQALCDGDNCVIRYDENAEKYMFSTPFWEAFLRMQFSVEKKHINNARKRRKNKKLLFKNQDDIDAQIYAAILRIYGDKLKDK